MKEMPQRGKEGAENSGSTKMTHLWTRNR